MIKVNSLAGLILTLLIALIWTCSKKKSTEPEGETIIADNVVIPEKQAGVYLDTVIDSTYIFKFTDKPPEISEDDILIGTSFGGYLRRVASVTMQDSSMEIETEYAVLTDAIIEGSLDTTFQLNIESLPQQTEPGLRLIRAAKGVSITNGVIDLSGVELFSGKIGEADVEVSISQGSVSFNPDIDLNFKMKSRQIKYFRTIARGKLNFDCDLRVSVSDVFTYTKEVNIATLEYSFVQWVGWVPVVEVVTLNFDAGFNAVVSGAEVAEFGFENSMQVSFGAKYENGAWSSVWEKKPSFKAHSVDWMGIGGVKIRPYIKPNLHVKLYAITGPYLEIVPYLRFEGEITTLPSWQWSLYGGGVGRLGFDVGILDHNIADYNTSLAQYETKIADGSSSSTNIAYADFDSADEGWDCEGDGTCSHPDTGGNPGGFLKSSGPNSGEDTYALAPMKFTFKWSDLDCKGYLQFDQIILSGSGGQSKGPNVIVYGYGVEAEGTYKSENGPLFDSWRTYVFPISKEFWTINSGSLADLQSSYVWVKIGMEFLSGVEETGIDNVILAKLNTDPNPTSTPRKYWSFTADGTD